MAPLPAPQNAAALSYRAGDRAPRVVAKGHGSTAQEIIRKAREAGVYVHQSPELVGMLMGVDLDRHIPPELYIVIAELLVWLHRAEQLQPALRPAASVTQGSTA